MFCVSDVSVPRNTHVTIRNTDGMHVCLLCAVIYLTHTVGQAAAASLLQYRAVVDLTIGGTAAAVTAMAVTTVVLLAATEKPCYR